MTMMDADSAHPSVLVCRVVGVRGALRQRRRQLPRQQLVQSGPDRVCIGLCQVDAGLLPAGSSIDHARDLLAVRALVGRQVVSYRAAQI